jgi:hypothetical protein
MVIIFLPPEFQFRKDGVFSLRSRRLNYPSFFQGEYSGTG